MAMDTKKGMKLAYDIAPGYSYADWIGWNAEWIIFKCHTWDKQLGLPNNKGIRTLLINLHLQENGIFHETHMWRQVKIHSVRGLISARFIVYLETLIAKSVVD